MYFQVFKTLPKNILPIFRTTIVNMDGDEKYFAYGHPINNDMKLDLETSHIQVESHFTKQQ